MTIRSGVGIVLASLSLVLVDNRFAHVMGVIGLVLGLIGLATGLVELVRAPHESPRSNRNGT
jgi:hypothetical protein